MQEGLNIENKNEKDLNSDSSHEEEEMFGSIDIGDPKMSPLVYYGKISGINDCIREILQSGLDKKSNYFGQNITFIVPGSDGRNEKGSMASRVEFIAITDDAGLDLNDYKRKLILSLNGIFPSKVSAIEMKGPNTSLVHYNDNNNNENKRPQPGRVADGRLVYGDANNLTEIKIKLGQQIMALDGSSFDKINSLKKDARKTTEQGKNRIAGLEAVHFDLENGTVFFNPKAFQLSFKIGPLRLVQNTLLLEEVRHIRAQNDPKFISNLEPSIVKRLDQLSDDGMLNRKKESVDEIKEHYAFFLRLYHKSERAYQKDRQVVLQLTPKEVIEVSERLKALLELMKEFKIQKQPTPTLKKI